MQEKNKFCTINVTNVEKAWFQYCKYGLLNGILIEESDGNLYESPAITIQINKPEDNSSSYFNQELIQLYVSKIYKKTIIKELNSTYGDMLFDNQGINQVDWLIKKIIKKPTTKGATICLISPLILNSDRRLPCLTSITIKFRNNRLNLYSTFRSQNIFNSYANFIALYNLQTTISKILKIPSGFIHIYITSPHIYEKDYNKIKEIVNSLKDKNYT